MLTERIDSPSNLPGGKKFFTVMQYSHPKGGTDIVSMALEETQMTEEGFESKKIEVAIDYTHKHQRETSVAYFAYNLVNGHVFEDFKNQENTQVQTN